MAKLAGIETADRDYWRQYGPAFLAVLEEQKDWRSIEALWRYGGADDMTGLASVMARSADLRLSLVLANALRSGRYVDQVPTLPEILYTRAPKISESTAVTVLERLLNDDEPLEPAYANKRHLIIGWLVQQPGPLVDDLAIDIAFGTHDHAETPEPKDAAINRIARSSQLGARLIQRLLDDPMRWSTGATWSRTADVVGRIGSQRGRADLVRAMTSELITLPPEEVVQPSQAFVRLIEKHGSSAIADAFRGDPLGSTSATAATVRAIAVFKPGQVRDDLVETLAGHQPALWSAFRSEVYDSWSIEDWQRMLTRWATPGSVLSEAGEVIDDAPPEAAVQRIRVGVVHCRALGDFAARVAQRALNSTVRAGDEDVDVNAAVAAVPWDLVTSTEAEEYVNWIIAGVLATAEHCTTVARAYADGLLPADRAAALIPEDQYVAAFAHLQPGPARAAFAAALHEHHDGGSIGPVLREVIDSSNDSFDVIEAVAAHDCHLAFETFDEDRWHNLDLSQKDRLLSLLEEHATLDQQPLLDTIAHDSDGPNAARRARAARCWANLTPLHSMIPAGILSLLESAVPALNQTFAEVAAQVQPRDEGSLASLQDKWLNGGKTGASARSALDDVAEGLVTTLNGLRPPERRDQCPDLLHLLGVTAAPSTFSTLLAYVGADAVDDSAALRRAAAAAIRAFVNVTRLTGNQLDALGVRLGTETDPAASDDLRSALAAADLGDDAAILGLYAVAGLTADAVAATPDELFGDEKPRLLTALKKMRTQQALGEPGWDGYVEQMDLVGEALTRTVYLRFGQSEPLKTRISSGKHNEPEYGSLVKAVDKVAGFSPASANLQTVHNMRTTRTAAHHPTGGALDEDSIIQAENALRTATRYIVDRLRQDQPVLRALPAPDTDVDQEIS
jgi:hypothetical protein